MLLITACTHFNSKQADKLPQNIFEPDVLCHPSGNAQLDSLLHAIDVALPDTNLANLYFKIGELYEDNDFELAKVYYLKMGNLCDQIQWNEGLYLFACVFSSLLIREGLCDSALAILDGVYELAVNDNNKEMIANLTFTKGNAYFMKEWYETALTYFIEALSFYETTNALKQQQLFYMMAQLYQSIDASEKAIEYAEKSVAINSEDPFALATLAMSYSSAHQYEKAKKYYEAALSLERLQYNDYLRGLLYFHIANDALFSFDLERAEKYAYQSMEINRQFGSAVYFTDLILLSKLEQVKGNFSKSEEYALEALQIAIELEALKEQRICYNILSELAITQHKFRENIQYWEESNLIELAIAKETSLRAAEEMFAKFETEKKELEIKQQYNIIGRHKLQRGLLVGGISLSILVLLLLWLLLGMRTRRNRELAEINITKDKFFNIISHDLKNPAIAQRNTLKILVQNANSWTPETLADYHRELLNSAEEEVALIFNLLNWAQLQTGKIACTFEPFLLSSFHQHLSLIRKMAENKEITINCYIPENEFITGDENILTTVIRNLLTNAVKYTAQGGTVTLDISPCKDVADNLSKGYTFSVTDTGTGMSDEQLKNLFYIGKTRSCRGTAGEQGSGLGLIICRELLEKHSSKLHVESEEGKGSRFWFEV